MMIHHDGKGPLDSARVIEVIETTLTRRGDGKDRPIRIVRQYWTLEGNLLAEVDPCPENEHELKVLQAAIRWALGEIDDFPDRKQGEGAYWWRKELRRRASGLIPKDGSC